VEDKKKDAGPGTFSSRFGLKEEQGETPETGKGEPPQGGEKKKKKKILGVHKSGLKRFRERNFVEKTEGGRASAPVKMGRNLEDGD